MNVIYVDEEFDGLRIDRFMTLALQEYSRTQIQEFIDLSMIKLNQQKVKANTKVQTGDEITYSIQEEEFMLKPIDMNLDIIYEDDDLMVVNKEAGLIVHPSSTTGHQQTLVHGLLSYTNQLSDLGGTLRPGIVHRLDKGTSGLLIVAKHNESHQKLVEMLRNREIVREYVMIVHHPFAHQQAHVDAPIGRDPKHRQKMAVTHINAKEARSDFYLIENFNGYALLKGRLDTGRTHQLRLHARYMGHPIVGDELYAYKNSPKLEKGHALHASHLEFVHPINQKSLSFDSEMPKRMKDLYEFLRSD